MTAPVQPQLATLDEQFADVSARVEREFAGVPDDTFRRRPAPAAWSAAECIAHLTLTTRNFLPLLDAALALCPPVPAGRAIRHRAGILGTLLARVVEPSSKLRVTTAKSFVPEADQAGPAVRGAFEESQRLLRERLVTADGRDLGRAKIRSPFDGRVHYNVYATFVILAAHQRRHVAQALLALRSSSETAPHA